MEVSHEVSCMSRIRWNVSVDDESATPVALPSQKVLPERTREFVFSKCNLSCVRKSEHRVREAV